MDINKYQLIQSIVIFILAQFVICSCFAAVTTITTTQNILSDSTKTDGNVDTRRNVDNSNKLVTLCPHMFHHIFDGMMPRDKAKAGKFEEFNAKMSLEAIGGVIENDVDLRTCVAGCCEKAHNNTCNIVFLFRRKCYHVHCVSNEACLPVESNNSKDRLKMVLVNPVRNEHDSDVDNLSWLDVLKSVKINGVGSSGVGIEANGASLPFDELSVEDTNPLSFWKQSHKFHYPSQNQGPTVYDEEEFPIAEKRMKQLLEETDSILPNDIDFYGGNSQASDVTNFGKYITCDLDNMGGRCPVKEECAPISANSPTGICKCIRGYIRNAARQCIPATEVDFRNFDDISNVAQNMLMSGAASDVLPISVNDAKKDSLDAIIDSETTTKTEIDKKITVSVASKEVQLPDMETTLTAITVPDEQTSGISYRYLWTLVSQPKGPMNGTISDQTQSKVHLSNLSEGLYTFKVTVTDANGAYGEAMANVTVLPKKRINRVPQVVITPKVQTIRPPTTNAVLDGSTSTDDDKIVSWHWEVVSGPIGYQPNLPDVSTLQLTDLTAPGNYTFKLILTDSDNVTNSTTANITVLQPTDYPPVANAGDAVILYLPNNNVTLNGTASTDDHEIVAWEWTKDASSETKAVDMQNTRTPYVQLSNLEEGMYTFALKVTDGSGQSSSAKVHVFVKPPTNMPPVAVAIGNLTVNLPQNWAILNGSRSTDDIRIQSYQWKQVSGPNNAKILKSNESIANATSLTLGIYTFELTVMDEHNNSATDSTWIKVVQEKNTAPIANAGGDQTVTLPITALYLNGTKSWDDLAVVKYLWTREDGSLAAGTIVGSSNKEPVLVITNLVPGHFVFKLTVSDDQGLTGSDTVNIIVHEDPLLMNLVQLTLPMGASTLLQSELNTIVQKVGLLLGDMKVVVRELKYDTSTDVTILVFYVETTDSNGKTTPVDGLYIEQLLKDKLQRDASILGTIFVDVRTTICQNKCSNHGVCNAETRACICESFWMPSGGYFYGVDEANCDWSILYVFVGVIMTLVLLSALFWSIACACRQNKKPKRTGGPRPKAKKYSLIGTQDEESPHFGRTNTSLTDSETDSDVLFETRSKPNGILRSNGSIKAKQNQSQRKYPLTKTGRKVKT